MQSINIAVLNPVFLSVFVGTAVACLIAIVFSWLRWNQPAWNHVRTVAALAAAASFSLALR